MTFTKIAPNANLKKYLKLEVVIVERIIIKEVEFFEELQVDKN